MLRQNSSYNQAREIEFHHQKLYTYTCIGVGLSLFLFGGWSRISDNQWLYAVAFFSLFVSVYTAGRAWGILVVLLGRLFAPKSDDDPEFMQKFSETWLRHEFVLSVFVVTWGVSMTMMLFELLAPLVDSLIRPGAP